MPWLIPVPICFASAKLYRNRCNCRSWKNEKAPMENGSVFECDAVSPVEIGFENRRSVQRAMVLPGDSEPLLRAILLENMDVVIHPLGQELIVNPEHPYFAQMKLK